jgi:cytochrome c oxidase assembly protein subunit 15
MAVPDWPTTYGYNMLFFPISKWVGGIFYEHTHRLLAASVGLLTSILAAWVWGRETEGRTRWMGWGAIGLLVAMLGHRSSDNATGGLEAVPLHFRALALVLPALLLFSVFKTVQARGSLRWLAMTAFFAVIFQGILGGFRVAQMQDALGIFHATLAQLFFTLLCAIALSVSRWWVEAPNFSVYEPRRLRYVIALVTGLILVQLILGATMRHQHAGLAIHDFPLAYGKLWPATDAESVAHYNQTRVEATAQNPITAAQIGLQMVHRLLAFTILGGVAWAAAATLRRAGWKSPFGRLSALWLGLIVVQVILGASVIWTGKAADIATAHVAVGALSLATGTMLLLLMSCVTDKATRPALSTANDPVPASLQQRPANVSA